VSIFVTIPRAQLNQFYSMGSRNMGCNSAELERQTTSANLGNRSALFWTISKSSGGIEKHRKHYFFHFWNFGKSKTSHFWRFFEKSEK